MSTTPICAETPILDAPVLEDYRPRTIPAYPPPVPVDPKLRPEYEAFLQLYPDLLKTHYDKYVAIYQGNVVESGDTFVAVASRATKRFGRVPIYVNLITDKPRRVERIPTFRELPREGSR